MSSTPAPAQAAADDALFDDEADDALFDDEADDALFDDEADDAPRGATRRAWTGGPGRPRDPEAEADAIHEAFRDGTLDASGCRDLVRVLGNGAEKAAARGDAARAARFHRTAAGLARALGYPRAAVRAAATRATAIRRLRAPRRTSGRRAPRRAHAGRVRLSAVASAGDGPPSADPDGARRTPRSGARGAP